MAKMVLLGSLLNASTKLRPHPDPAPVMMTFGMSGRRKTPCGCSKQLVDFLRIILVALVECDGNR